MATEDSNSEQSKRIQDMSIPMDFSKMMTLQLHMDAKLTVLISKVTYLIALKTGEDANALLDIANKEVNKETFDRFEDLHKAWGEG